MGTLSNARVVPVFDRGRLPVSSLSTVEGNPYAPASTVETRNVVMANYMVRVEIFKADSEEYADLHKALEALGLKRTVQGDNGVLRMPPGTYYGASSLGTYELREKVKTIAAPFSYPADPSVFVSESSDWSGWLRLA
ncbi:hypothetical protein [Pseudomonas carnis]|nr:hypothetical protein [Pseudomonas carnis]